MMRCAFALAFVLSAAAPALGQDAEPDVVSLRVEACGVTWASPEVLASLLRVELRNKIIFGSFDFFPGDFPIVEIGIKVRALPGN